MEDIYSKYENLRHEIYVSIYDKHDLPDMKVFNSKELEKIFNEFGDIKGITIK